MHNRHAIDERVFRGLVLDRYGVWRSIDEAIAVEEEYFSNLANGKILHKGQWTRLEDVREESLPKPFPASARPQGRRTTTRLETADIQKKHDEIEEQKRCLGSRQPSSQQPPAGASTEAHSAGVVSYDRPDVAACEMETKQIEICQPGSVKEPQTALLRKETLDSEPTPSSSLPSDDSLLDVSEFENVLAAMQNGEAKAEEANEPVAVLPKRETAEPVSPPDTTMPKPSGQEDSEDNWNAARSKNTKVIIGTIIVMVIITGIILVVYLT